MVNKELLRTTMDFINANPQLHNQGDWIEPCNSTMCFAGHAAILAGATFDQKIWEMHEEWDVDATTGKHGIFQDYNDPASMNLCHVSDFAQNKLGISFAEREYLFSPSRTREQLNRFVDDKCAE